jgi:SAM-dependent methyltransferase
MSCGACAGVEAQFDGRIARRDLRRYRRHGPARTTRILLDALADEGVGGATLLDIGGGVGAIPNELIRRGVEGVTVVDASPAYLEVARAESERQGNAGRITYHPGDFVELAPEVAPAAVVTLDRVICCYGDMDALVAAAAGRATRLLGAVFPRDTWWDRLGVSLVNLACRVRRSPFRAYVHPPAEIERVLAAAGLEPRFRRRTVVWEVVVYGR